MKDFTKRQMVMTLESNKLDHHRTAHFLGEFGCADVFGGTFLANTSEGFLENLAKLNVDVSGWKFSDGLWSKGEVKEVVEKVSETTDEVLNDTEDSIVEPEIVEDTTEVEDVQVEPVDWEWVENLTNTSPSKKSLEEYARKWNVELKRNKSLENMIKDFKEAMQA